MRAWLLFTVLLIGAALSGCIGSDDDLSEAALTTPTGDALPSVTHLPGGVVTELPSGVTQPLARMFDIGHEAVEPTLGFTSDGTIFYAAAKFTDDPVQNPVTEILRSVDGGQSWELVTPRLPGDVHAPPSTGDPYVWVDRNTDRVFALDMHPALTCSWLSYSDDLGETWTSQPAACMGNPPVYDHQSITSGPAAMTPTPVYDGIVYQCINRITDSQCARSLDGGLTWTTGVPVFSGYNPAQTELNTTAPPGGPVNGVFQGLCGGLHGHVAVSPTDGTVVLPRTYCGEPVVGVSHDDGLTWEVIQVADYTTYSSHEAAVAFDAAGNTYYVTVDEGGKLMLSVSQDSGMSWSQPLDVTPPGVTATHLPTVAAGDEGHVAIAYAGTENLEDGYKSERFHSSADDAFAGVTWNGYITVLTDALADQPVLQTSYVNHPSEPLVRGYCGPGRCPGMYDFIDIEISPDGRPMAAFVDACVDVCDTPEGTWEDSQGDNMAFRGTLAVLDQGPRLIGGGQLAPLE